VIRLALAAIVFCAALSAAFGQSAPGCPAAENEREWRPQHHATASITESSWKWRTLHAAVVAAVGPEAFVFSAPADPFPAPATAAPSYLLHTPLLI
jgi:hypothetical protein